MKSTHAATVQIKPMAPLLAPKETILLLFASSDSLVDPLHLGESLDHNKDYKLLLEAAKLLDIPIWRILNDKTRDARQDIQEHSTYILESLSKQWDETYIGKALIELQRTSLLLMGKNISTTISFFALSAYAKGYDVFCIAPSDRKNSDESDRFALHRLMQTGVIVTTEYQTLIEWSNHVDDLGLYNQIIIRAQSI